MGREAGLGFGRRAAPRDTSLGLGERGVLKGWAAEVEVAGVAPVASCVVGVVENAWRSAGVRREVGFNEAFRRQDRQIMVVRRSC